MYEGKPLVLVVGGSDTGRTPMAAALLRRALGPDVVVHSAGVLSHEGESATPEAQMALEQLSINISRHISRPLRNEEHRNADLLVAIDRGTQMVLFAEFPQDSRVTCLPVLASMPDVLDPHRMPLGVWVAALKQLSDQVSAAAPQIRTLLGIAEAPPLPPPTHTVEHRQATATREPLVLGTGHKMQWDRDEDMQRLLQLISAEPQEQPGASIDAAIDASPVSAEDTNRRRGAEGNAETMQATVTEEKRDLPGWDAAPDIADNGDEPNERAPIDPTQGSPAQPAKSRDRNDHIRRMLKLLQTAQEMPEIVDWRRLSEELVSHLRAVAQLSAGLLDFTPAATLMIEGKLGQLRAQPSTTALGMLNQSIKRLEAPLTATTLAAIGRELAEW